MRDDLRKSAAPDTQPIDPVKMARRHLKQALPRRFWSEVAIVARDGGFGIDLDGKPVRTPAKAWMVVPTQELAEVLAAEWRAQEETVEPDSMPLTRLVNSAIDGVGQAMVATIDEVSKFAETDLVCYRAGEPDTLVEAQAAAWDPILAFARDSLGARFICSEGVMFVEQPKASRVAVRRSVEAVAVTPLRLAALSVMTSLTGSVLIGLAVVHRTLSAEAAWDAGNVDEDHQLRTWGDDAEALDRRDRRRRDMYAAVQVFALGARRSVRTAARSS